MIKVEKFSFISIMQTRVCIQNICINTCKTHAPGHFPSFYRYEYGALFEILTFSH